MKYIYIPFILLLCCLSTGIQAQNLTNHIPSTALGVLRIDAERYSNKVDMDQVMELDLFKMMDMQAQQAMQGKYDMISKIYKSPKEAGIDLFPQSYAYVEMIDSLYLVTYLFKVSEQSKLEGFLNETIVPMSKGQQAIQGSGYQYLMPANGGVMMVSWTESTASFMFIEGDNSSLYNDLDYDDPNYYQEVDKRKAAYTQQKQAALMAKANRITGLKKGSILSNPNFKTFEKNPFDIAVWLSANAFSKLISQAAMNEIRDPQQQQLMAQVQSLNKDYYYHLGLDFDAGALDLKLRTFLPPTQFAKYATLYNKRPNAEFFQYVMGSSVMGMGSIAIDIKSTIAALLETYKPMLAQSPEFGPMVEPTLNLLGIALDEDALADIFKGDMMFAVTDVREVETTYIDYVYDEDFNMEKVEKTRKSKQPIITGMATIGNEANFNKLINAIQAYGFMKKEGKVFKLTIPNASISPTLAIVDGLLIATNDDQLIAMIQAGKSVKKKEQLGKFTQAEILKHSQYFMLNIDGIMNVVLEEENIPNRSGIELLAQKFNDAKLTGLDTKNNYFEYDFVIDMKDQETNAAMQLFQIANEFFLMQGK